MALTCNIDSRGRAARLKAGVALLGAGVLALLVWAIPSGGALGWAVGLLLTGGGAFAIFEARAGWCAVRALGIKTPI